MYQSIDATAKSQLGGTSIYPKKRRHNKFQEIVRLKTQNPIKPAPRKQKAKTRDLSPTLSIIIQRDIDPNLEGKLDPRQQEIIIVALVVECLPVKNDCS